MSRLWPRTRWARGLITATLALAVLIAVDAVVLTSRIEEWPVTLPTDQDDVDTWLIVGSDSREHTPSGARPADFGTTDQVTGERADLIIVVTIRDDKARAVSIPRDLLVTDRGYPKRLALTLQDGPQRLVDAVCSSLRVPIDHLVGLHFDGFAAIIDSLGGIDVTIDYPVRDPLSGLDLPTSGKQRLDGAQALALVRSRSAERLIDGVWTPSDTGVHDRANWGAAVLTAALDRAFAKRANPVAMQQFAWASTGALRADDDTGLLDLLSLARQRPEYSVLPHDPATAPAPEGTAAPLPPNAHTMTALNELGVGKRCTPGTRREFGATIKRSG